MSYLLKSCGEFSATKTMLTIGGILVIARWLIGGVDVGEVSISYVTGAEVAFILAALGFNRGFSSQHRKPKE